VRVALGRPKDNKAFFIHAGTHGYGWLVGAVREPPTRTLGFRVRVESNQNDAVGVLYDCPVNRRDAHGTGARGGRIDTDSDTHCFPTGGAEAKCELGKSETP